MSNFTKLKFVIITVKKYLAHFREINSRQRHIFDELLDRRELELLHDSVNFLFEGGQGLRWTESGPVYREATVVEGVGQESGKIVREIVRNTQG